MIGNANQHPLILMANPLASLNRPALDWPDNRPQNIVEKKFEQNHEGPV